MSEENASMPEAKVEYMPVSKPWVEREGRLHLIGMKCVYCLTMAFPACEVCSSCGQPDGLTPHEMSSHGKLHAFTEVHDSPAGFQTPCVIAYVDLEDGVRVLAQIDGSGVALATGQPVVAHLGTIRTRNDGARIVSYRFRGAA